MGVPGQRLRVDAGEEARHRSGGELRNGPRSRGAVGPAGRDAALQVAELSRGLGAGLLGQQRAVGLVGAERLGLATLACQRAHQEPSRTVPVRVVLDEQGHLGGDLREAAARQARFASRFLGGDALLVEPGGGSLRPGFVGELLQRGACPEAQRPGEERRGLDRWLPLGVLDHGRELRDVGGGRAEHVAGRHRLDGLGPQHLPQAAHGRAYATR